MKPSKILQAAEKYQTLLEQEFVAEQVSDEYKGDDKIVWLKHATWMSHQIPEFIQQKRVDKAMRWLCCIQGIVLTTGHVSVKEAKMDNMPDDGRTYNRSA